MSDIQYPENGQRNVGFSATDNCGNRTRGDRMVNIIQKLLEGRYVEITEDGDTATISVDPSADYYNKFEINELLGNLGTVQFKIVSALPSVGATNVIYLVEKTAPDVGYNQYIWNTEDMTFFPIGDTDIDLSDYYTKIQSDNKFQQKLTRAQDITVLSESTEISQVDLANNMVHKIAPGTIWNYIRDKITGSASTAITDNLTRSRVIVTDADSKFNVSSVYSAELEQLSGIDTTKSVQTQLNAKQDVFTYSGEIAEVDDDTAFSVVNLYAKRVSTIIGSTIWTYIKSKMAGAISSVIQSDLGTSKAMATTSDGKIGATLVTRDELYTLRGSDTSTTIQAQIDEIWDEMWKKIYPVGSIYTTITQDNPATLFGGTWEIVSAGRYLRGEGATATVGTFVDQQLPNVKGQVSFASGSQGHPELSSPSGAFQTASAGSLTYPWPTDGTSGGARILRIDASKQTNSVYKDNGNVIPNSYTVHFWKRIS